MSAVIIPMPTQPPASPQVENGYTRISNELMGALAVANLGGAGWDVIAVIIRKTYGFNKKEDDLALSQMAKMLGQGEDRKGNISRVVSTLVKRRILTISNGVHARAVSINKDYTQWEGMTQEDLKTVRQCWGGTDTSEGVIKSITQEADEGYQIDNSGVIKSITLGLSNLQPQKTTSKDNYQKTKDKDSCAPQAKRDSLDGDARADRKGRATTALTAEQQQRFNKFYEAYPRKRSPSVAKKAFAKIDPSDELLAEMLAAIERANQSTQWRTGFAPHPASWLNAGAWQDEIQTGYAERERQVIESWNDTLGEAQGAIDADVFSESRATAVRHFLTLSTKPEFWLRFFPWIQENCELPPRAGFDWLITPEGFTKVQGGQFLRNQ